MKDLDRQACHFSNLLPVRRGVCPQRPHAIALQAPRLMQGSLVHSLIVKSQYALLLLTSSLSPTSHPTYHESYYRHLYHPLQGSSRAALPIAHTHYKYRPVPPTISSMERCRRIDLQAPQ